jgi:protein O-mannosyl-transferase
MPSETAISHAASYVTASKARRSQNVRARYWGGASIAALALLAYWPSLNGQFILDDDLLVTENHLIQARGGLYRIWFTSEAPDYWPVTNTTLWLEWRLWGMNPTGYHVTNLVLHIIASLLVWKILRKLGIPGAWLAALLFAVHPVNVESVAWIAQLKNVLSMLFFLLAILCYLKVDTQASPQSESQPASGRTASGKIWYGLSLAAFVLAMLSKGSVAILPLLLLLISWWLAGRLTKQAIIRTVPFFLVAAVLTMVNVWFQTHGSHTEIRPAGLAERTLGAGAVVWVYLFKALWPLNLAFIYPQWHIQVSDLQWWLPLLATLVVTIVLWSLCNLPNAPSIRQVFLAWCFFCMALVPVMGFIDVGYMKVSLVADHYQYIALLSVVGSVAAGWSLLQGMLKGPAKHAAIASAAFVVLAFAFLTWQQSRLYAGPILLYEDTLAKNPTCWLAHNNLGVALSEGNDWGHATGHFQQALEMKPDSADALAHNNLGVALTESGDLEEAISHFQRVLQIKPDYADAEDGLGMALYKAGRTEEAKQHLEQAILLQPDNLKAHSNLAMILTNLGQLDAAIEQSGQAIRINPNYSKAHNNFGIALAEAGRLSEAIDQFAEAIRLRPDDATAYYNFGNALSKSERPEEAIKYYQESLRLKPDYTEAWANLAAAYADSGRESDAIATGKKALELAQSQGQIKLVQQIDDWLKRTQAHQATSQITPQQPGQVRPAP